MLSVTIYRSDSDVRSPARLSTPFWVLESRPPGHSVVASTRPWVRGHAVSIVARARPHTPLATSGVITTRSAHAFGEYDEEADRHGRRASVSSRRSGSVNLVRRVLWDDARSHHGDRAQVRGLPPRIISSSHRGHGVTETTPDGLYPASS